MNPERKIYIDNMVSQIRSDYGCNGGIDWNAVAVDQGIDFLVDKRFFIPSAGYREKDSRKVVCVSPYKIASNDGLDIRAHEFAHILLAHREPECTLTEDTLQTEADYFASKLIGYVHDCRSDRFKRLLARARHPIYAYIAARSTRNKWHRHTNRLIRKLISSSN